MTLITTKNSNNDNIIIQFNNNYSPDIEEFLERIRKNSIMLSREHQNRYLYLRDTLKYYRIPIIIVSSFSSIVSMSQQFIPQDLITILNTVLSFICSIIGAIELFMQISQQMVHEKGLSTDYYILASDIYKCLGLKPENRTSDGKTFLEEKYGTYVKLIEGSDIIRKNIKDQLCEIPDDLLLKNDLIDLGGIVNKKGSKKHKNKNCSENEHNSNDSKSTLYRNEKNTNDSICGSFDENDDDQTNKNSLILRDNINLFMKRNTSEYIFPNDKIHFTSSHVSKNNRDHDNTSLV